MSLDRDVVLSLELLAPSRSRAALQKALAGSTTHIHNKASAQPSTTPAAAAAGDMDADDVFEPRGSSRGRASSSRGAGRHKQMLQAAAANKRCSSLFGFLNYTSTSCGARLLRTNLLQPLKDINTLQLRLDSLQVCARVQSFGCLNRDAYWCSFANTNTPWPVCLHSSRRSHGHSSQQPVRASQRHEVNACQSLLLWRHTRREHYSLGQP